MTTPEKKILERRYIIFYATKGKLKIKKNLLKDQLPPTTKRSINQLSSKNV